MFTLIIDDLDPMTSDLHLALCVCVQMSDVQVAYCDSREPAYDDEEDHVTTTGSRIPPPPPPPRASLVLECQQPLLPHRLTAPPTRCIHSNSRDAVV